MAASKAVYDFVFQLNRDKALLRRFESDPASVLAEMPLTDAEKDKLLDGSPEKLSELGMHPLVLMRYSLARNPAIKAHISLKDYLAEMGAHK